MKLDPVKDAGILHILRRGTAEILRESENGIFLRDTVSDAYMLACSSEDEAVSWLRANEQRGYGLLTLADGRAADYAASRYHLTGRLDCFQAVYLKNEPPAHAHGLTVREAVPADLQFVAEHYDMLDENDIEKIIRRGELLIGCRGEEIAGFAGEHLEGSIGLLEVLPEFRGQGCATQLECAVISRILKRGFTPFGQIVKGNTASLRLQAKLGLEISGGYVSWLF